MSESASPGERDETGELCPDPEVAHWTGESFPKSKSKKFHLHLIFHCCKKTNKEPA